MTVKKKPRVMIHLWDEGKIEEKHKESKDIPRDKLNTADIHENAAEENAELEKHVQEPESTVRSISKKLKRFLRETGLFTKPPKK